MAESGDAEARGLMGWAKPNGLDRLHLLGRFRPKPPRVPVAVAFKSRCGQGGLGTGGPPPDDDILMNHVQNHDLIDGVDTADAPDEFYRHGKFSEPRLPSLCVNHCLKPVFHPVQTTVDDMPRDKVRGWRIMRSICRGPHVLHRAEIRTGGRPALKQVYPPQCWRVGRTTALDVWDRCTILLEFLAGIYRGFSSASMVAT